MSSVDLSSPPVQRFLDAVDLVLNSNTFLLHFDIGEEKLQDALFHFINSPLFMEQLAMQDKQRGWFNLHYLDHKTGTYQVKRGHILENTIQLKIKACNHDKRAYLMALLTGDVTLGKF